MKYNYCYEGDLVSLEWLFKHNIIRVVRGYYNRHSRQKEVWMYHEYNETRWGSSWVYGYHVQPDQVTKVLELAKKNHVNIMGIT